MAEPRGTPPHLRLLPSGTAQEPLPPASGERRLALVGSTAKGQRPILITGSHRSGSTWVGRTLAAAPGVAYLDEPFHPRHRPGTCCARFERWYTYVTAENEEPYRRAVERALIFDYAWRDELRALRGPRDLGRMARDWTRFVGWSARGARPLVKDPIAFFSAPWLAETFDCDVVVLVRHPAAFASSLVRLDWRFDFHEWLAQPLLVRDWLAPWEAEIEDHATRPRDLLAQAALLWKVIYGVAEQFRERYPRWRFVRHEDLSLDPLRGFQELCGAFELEFEPRVRRSLTASTAAGNPAEAPTGVAHALARDSRANVASWKRRLAPEDVTKLRGAIEEAASTWYGPESW